MIARALTKARAARPLDELSEAADVSRQTIALAEAGRPALTTAQLARLADALHVDVAALYRGEVVRRESPSIFFRHQSYHDFSAADLPVLDRALEQGRALRYLSDRLAQPAPPVFEHRKVGRLRGKRAAAQGYALARRVRVEMGMPTACALDLVRLLEEVFRVAVVHETLSSARVVASSVRVPEGAAIVLNALDSVRLRNPVVGSVHLAHELCHVLFDPSEGGLNFVYDLDDDSDASGLEQRARGFAAEFLLPWQGLFQMEGEPQGLVSRQAAESLIRRVRSHFGTPQTITTNHLVNHGYIHPSMREALADMSPEVVGDFAPALPPVGEPSAELRRLVQAAHECSLISDGESRTALGIDILEPLPWS